jgi:uncharacterized protein YicC (UPF0701 family)
MSVTDKGTEGPVTAMPGEKVEVLESVAELYTSGVERLAEIQKTSIDAMLAQNSALVKTWKKQAAAVPGLFFLDLATTAFERYAETHKGAIDVVVEQTRTLAGLVKERRTEGVKILDETVKRAKEVVEQSVDAQKAVLDNAKKQTREAFEAARKHMGYAGTPAAAAADSVEKGIEVMVDAQKELLDLVAERVPVVH